MWAGGLKSPAALILDGAWPRRPRHAHPTWTGGKGTSPPVRPPPAREWAQPPAPLNFQPARSMPTGFHASQPWQFPANHPSATTAPQPHIFAHPRNSPCSRPQVFIHRRQSNRRGRSSGVEHNLAKVRVVSSNLIARSSRTSSKGAFRVTLGAPFVIPGSCPMPPKGLPAARQPER